MSRVVTSGAPLVPGRLFLDADRAARVVAAEAGAAALAAVKPSIPRMTGQAAENTRVRVRSGIEGHYVTVGPSKKVAWRVKFFEEGTGIYGPKRRPIRPRHARAFKLPGGVEFASVKGQRARHTFATHRAAADAAFAEGVRAGLRTLDAALRHGR